MEGFIEQAIVRANSLSNHAIIFPRWQQVRSKFLEAVAEYQSKKVDHSRSITEFYNEVVIALDICVECERSGWRLDYEPICPNDQSIDFCIIKDDGARIYIDVKTVHPQNMDAIALYHRCINEGLFADNVGVHFQRLDAENLDIDAVLDGVTFHHVTAARDKFLIYSCEFETKIRSMTSGHIYKMLFCSDGFRWHLSDLEDFVDFYNTGVHRQDDPWSVMERHTIERKRIVFDRSISMFCYYERPQNRLEPRNRVFQVRGPSFG